MANANGNQKLSSNHREFPPLKNRTLLQSWLAIPARTRLFISLGFCVAGGTGLMISDYLEKTQNASTTSSSPNHNGA